MGATMREMSKFGMTLRWHEALDKSRRKVLLEAWPASPTHVVYILYTIGDGPLRMSRAWPVGPSKNTGFQTFAAMLPDVMPGEMLEWWPVLSNGVHDLAPETAPQASQPETKPKVQVPTNGRHHFHYEMEHLARGTAPLEKTPTMIGDTPEGLMIVFPLGSNGTVSGPKLNGKIEHVGGDWMRVRRDGVGVSEVRVVVDCDDGSKILGEYSGVVDFGPNGYNALSHGGGPKAAEVQLAPRFVSAAPKLEWLNRVQCVGLGRVTMSKLLVEYDLYAIRSHAIPDGGGFNA